MAEKIEQLRDELVLEIGSLVQVSESAFLSLGELYPKIIRELDSSLKRSTNLVAKKAGTIACSESFTVRAGQLAASGREIVEDSGEWFARMNVEDGVLIRELQTTIDSLSKLDEHIDRIREDSVEMELVSLNALTVALKSGTAGKGFSVITDELKRLSSRTIGMTERLTDSGKILFGQFSSFRAQLELLEMTREDLAREMADRLGPSFSATERSIAEVSLALKGLIEESGSVRAPIKAVMEGIQFGDIVRQSADHVILSLKELRQAESDSEAVYLDELRFLGKLSDLAHTLLAEIAAQLGRSTEEFERRSGEVLALIEGGEKERNRLLGFYGAENRTFDDAIAAITAIMQEIKRYAALKGELLGQGEGLIAAVGLLEDKFKAFTLVVNRFRTIDIASRIEVAKQSILRTMNDTVAAMSDLTVRIEGDVAESVGRTKGLIGDTREIIGSTRLSYGEIERKVAGTVEALERNLGGIGDLKESMRLCLDGFSLYTDDFLALVARSREEIEKLREVSAGVARAMSALERVKAQAESELRKRGDHGGLQNGELESGKLKGIIERFTIFTHKKAAGELGGFEVEGGVDNGEVTLF